MKKITVKNHQDIENNILELLNTFHIELNDNLNFTLKKINENKFEIIKNHENVIVLYAKKHQIYQALSYVLIHQNQMSYQIEKTPQLEHLGVMLDLARNAVLKMDMIKRYIKTIALLGYNYLELYVEDIIDVKEEPYLGYMRGKYTTEELKHLDHYAQSFGIEIVPCIQTLAHLERIFEHESYSQIRDIEDVLLVGEHKTYALIDHMLKACRNTFSSDHINIGMDEAFRLGLGAYLAKNGYQTKTNIMIKHLKKVLEIVEKYHYHPMMWADMFFQMSGGNYHLDEIEITQEVINQVPKNVTLIFWEYFETTYKKYDDKFRQIKRMSNDYSFAGGAWKWVGYTPLNQLSIKAMEASITACKDHHVKDFLLTAWGDDGAEASAFSIMASLIYVASSFINEVVNYDEMKTLSLLITRYNYDELLKMDTLNMFYDEVALRNPSKYLLFDDIFMSRLDYQVDIEFVGILNDKSKILHQLAMRDSVFNYLFEMQASLSDVLSAKVQLSVELLKAYQNKNKAEIKRILPLFDTVIKQLELFINAFENQWHLENKSFGYEIQNYRLGGLLHRIIYIKRQVMLYLEQKIDTIEQLDERLPSIRREKSTSFNSFIKNVTYGKM